MDQIKRCCGCKEVKSVSEFYKNRSAKDGLNSYCKACWNTRIDATIRSGKHKVYMATSIAREKADPKRLKKRQERIKRLNAARKYKPNYQESLDKARPGKRKHYLANKEQYLLNVSKRKARLFGSGGSHSSEAWRQLLDLFGHKCLCCGRTERITKDHIIPVNRGGSDDILNIQPLCIWCNKSKFTGEKDYRTREKVVLTELNAVGKLLFKGRIGKQDAEKLKKHETASHLTGVYYAPKVESTIKPWRAIITVDKKRIDLGRHATKEEAGIAYNEAAKKHRGPCAFVND